MLTKKPSFILHLLLVSLATIQIVEARIRHYKWEAKYEYKPPDCYEKFAVAINGQTPGPTILAQQNDTVVVELKNGLLTENVAIHWHGIRQIGSPWSDGTKGATQCPIMPGDTFAYKFVVDRPGTYLYYAHCEMQRRAGLYGSIRVSLPRGVSEPFSYDYDLTILLNDWYHKSTYEQATGLSSVPFRSVGEPQSLLIKGKGRFPCSSTPSVGAGYCNSTNPECSPLVLTVVPGKTYRLRIGSLATSSALSFGIEGHNMTVVEASGQYVEPFVVSNLFIYSGETYSVLIKADQDPSRNYWAISKVVSRNSTTPNGLAILNYYPNHPKRSPATIPSTGPQWNDRARMLAQSCAIKDRQGYIHPPPQTSDRVVVMLNRQNTINVSFTLPHTPYLITLKYNLTQAFERFPPPEGYDIYRPPENNDATSSNTIYRLKFYLTVDIILQDTKAMTKNNSETHPWHQHGVITKKLVIYLILIIYFMYVLYYCVRELADFI